MFGKFIAGLVLVVPLYAGAQVSEKICSLITSTDMSAIGATMKVKSLFAVDVGPTLSKDIPGWPKILDDGKGAVCSQRQDLLPESSPVFTLYVARTDVGAGVWNQSIAASAKYLSDKGMATVSLTAPGKASCFISPRLAKNNIEIEKGQVQCFGFKGKVMMQLAVDDGVLKQEALAKTVKDIVESVLGRL